jgi:hypothetical protein
MVDNSGIVVIADGNYEVVGPLHPDALAWKVNVSPAR